MGLLGEEQVALIQGRVSFSGAGWGEQAAAAPNWKQAGPAGRMSQWPGSHPMTPGHMHSGGSGAEGPLHGPADQAGLKSVELAHSFQAAPFGNERKENVQTRSP